MLYDSFQRLNISKSTWFPEPHGEAMQRVFLERLLEPWQIHLEKGEQTEKGTDPAVLRSQSRLRFIPKKKLGILLTIIWVTAKDYVRCGCVNGREERGPQRCFPPVPEFLLNSKGQESSSNDSLQLARAQ